MRKDEPDMKNCFLVITCCLCVGWFTMGPEVALAQDYENGHEVLATAELEYSNESIAPYYIDFGDGQYQGPRFLTRKFLYRTNGTYVNFWVQNNSAVPVTISISSGGSRVLAPGVAGHVSANVTTMPKYYTFTATPQSGSQININYGIKQRD